MQLSPLSLKYALYGGPTSEWLIRSDGYAISINSPGLEAPPEPVIDKLMAWDQATAGTLPGLQDRAVKQATRLAQ